MGNDVVETLKALYRSLSSDEQAAEAFRADPGKFLHDHGIDLSAYSPEDIVDASHLALEGADPAVGARVAAAPRLVMRLPAESDHEANLRHIGHFAELSTPDYEPPHVDHALSRDTFIDTHLRQDIIATNAGHHGFALGSAGPRGSPGVATGLRVHETEFGAGAGSASLPATLATPSESITVHPTVAPDVIEPLVHIPATTPEVPVQVPAVDHDSHLAPLVEEAEDAPEDPDDTPPTGAAHFGAF